MDYLAPSMRQYCQVANITDNRLIMIVANSSVATQLRFQTFDLLRQFKADSMLKKINEIQIKVRPYTFFISRFNTPTKNIAPLSEETANTIRSIASSLKDTTLRQIMEKIASRTKR